MPGKQIALQPLARQDRERKIARRLMHKTLIDLENSIILVNLRVSDHASLSSGLVRQAIPTGLHAAAIRNAVAGLTFAPEVKRTLGI